MKSNKSFIKYFFDKSILLSLLKKVINKLLIISHYPKLLTNFKDLVKCKSTSLKVISYEFEFTSVFVSII